MLDIYCCSREFFYRTTEMRLGCKFFKLAAILVLLSLAFLSCKGLEEMLFAVEKNGLYGYTNIKGDTVVACIYPLVYTDTISQIGFVADNEGKIRCIDHCGKFLFYVYPYDNGPDYPSDGLFRIMDENGLIGYADTLGHVVITPRFKFGFPSKDGVAKVTNEGVLRIDSTSFDPHECWVSERWYTIRTKP